MTELEATTVTAVVAASGCLVVGVVTRPEGPVSLAPGRRTVAESFGTVLPADPRQRSA